jgi:D-erythro-7,8-dihydroneopterin triphosphate epimerase
MEKRFAKINIENLKLRTYIGFSEHEKGVLQDVTINISFKYEISKAVETDLPEDVFNYRTLTKTIISAVQNSHFNLLESLTSMVFDLVIQNTELSEVYVRVDKPHALRFCDNVYCEIAE